jgi:hypothetical protein
MDEKQITDLEDLVTALYIQTSRIYDVLVTLLAIQNPDEAMQLLEQHKEGIIVTPVPALKGDDGE